MGSGDAGDDRPANGDDDARDGATSDHPFTSGLDGATGDLNDDAHDAGTSDRHTLSSDPMGTIDTAGITEGAAHPLGPPNGTQIERYVIIDKIGHGGMSVVYKAYDPELNRRIAIKLLRPSGGEGTSGAIARLRLVREAQALAQLSHPNVIAVYDVGTWEDHVFLAMEFVEGQSLRKWLADGRRPSRDVIERFIAAGRGLAATHLVGLIHRDFKPDNVMVGDDGRVRVVDFGLARPHDVDAEPATLATIAKKSGVSSVPPNPSATSARATRELTTTKPSERSLPSGGATPSPFAATRDSEQGDVLLNRALTEVGSIAGTPAFMSPEQHCGLQIDARTDQFSFCASLYMALYRRLPFRGSTTQELRDAICGGKVEPPPEGIKVPARVKRAIFRGLRVAPDERFASMDELLTELVQATINRRRQLLAGSAMAVLSVLAIAGFVRRGREQNALCRGFDAEIASVWSAEKGGAVRTAFLGTGRPHATETFNRVESALSSYASRWVSMRTQTCEATHVRGVQSAKLLDLRMACLDRRQVQLGALTTLLSSRSDKDILDKSVNAALGLPSLATCADEAALTAAFPPPEDPALYKRVDLLQKKIASAQALSDAGKTRDALAEAKAVDAEVRDVDYPPLRAESRLLLGQLLDLAGNAADARETLIDTARLAGLARDDRSAARAWARLIRTSGPALTSQAEAKLFSSVAEATVARAGDPPDLAAEIPFYLGGLDLLGGRYESARKLYERALALAESTAVTPKPTIAYYRSHLAATTAAGGDYQAALPLFERVLSEQEQMLGPRHPQVATTLTNLGLLQQRLSHFDRSFDLLQRALEIQEEAVGRDSHNVALALNNLGATQCELGRYDDAVATYRRAMAIWTRDGNTSGPLAYPVASLAQTLISFGNFDEARALAERAIDIYKKAFGDEHPDLAYPYETLGEIEERRGHYAEAEQRYRQGLASREHESDPHLVAISLTEIARIQSLRGKPTEARATIEKALALLEKGATDRERAPLFDVRSTIRLRQKDPPGAVEDAERALHAIEAVYSAAHPEVGRAATILGDALAANGRREEASAAYHRAVAAFPPGHPDLPVALLGLGTSLIAQAKSNEAVAPLERALGMSALAEGPSATRAKARSLLATATAALAGSDR